MNEETLFHAALARSTALERAAFLDGACAGKPELRAAVEALLAAHEASGEFLNSLGQTAETIDSGADSLSTEASGMGSLKSDLDPTPVAMTADYQSSFKPNVLIAGRYTLQDKIGEGGMGEVWVAKQSEPVKRKVALKLIKTGMDSRAVLQRFEQERQALAMMDHPNIARVLDGGLTPSGQPFFVMELVNGLALNKFCDEARLTPRERLELFVPICQAVQHAHQKGIVHRDLKPANILITIIDGKPVPKVIDFGVAKATGGKLTDESMSTQFGSVVGTLEYMSPEQAGFSGVDVDTRADIYSLGVILYELLTGLRPIDARRLKQAAITEMIRVIREEEPSKPSTRLSTDESLPSMAALRQTEPRKLMAMLRGELDWVVMKCLEKHRERRYETANGLAKDIQRYLANEPVEARPPSAGYRLSKFLRRNKGPVLATTVVLLASLGGLAGVLAVQAKANRDLSAKNQELVVERAKVQARYDLAVEAIETYHKGVTQDFLLKQEQFKDVRNRLLKSASDFYGKLGALLGKEADPASRMALWQANFELAGLTTDIGRTEDALAAHRQVLAAREALAAEFPENFAVKTEVGRSLRVVGNLLDITGRATEAEPTLRKALALLAKPAPMVAAADTAGAVRASCQTCLASILQSTGRNDEALSLYSQARAAQEAVAATPGATAESLRDLANTIKRLALLLQKTGNSSEAETDYRTALAHYQKLVDGNPTDVEFRSLLADCHNNLAFLLSNTGRTAQAENQYREAMAIQKNLAADNPALIEVRGELAWSHRNRARLLRIMGKPSEAVPEYRAAIEIGQKLAEENPALNYLRVRVALGQVGLGDALSSLGKSADAETAYREALSIQQKLVDDSPTITGFRNDLADIHATLGGFLYTTGKLSEAETEYREALSIGQKLVDDEPAATGFQHHLAISHNGLAGFLYSTGKSPSEAVTHHRSALAILQKLVENEPAVTRFRSDLADTHYRLGIVLAHVGKESEAEAEIRKAIALQQKVSDDNPEVTAFRSQL